MSGDVGRRCCGDRDCAAVGEVAGKELGTGAVMAGLCGVSNASVCRWLSRWAAKVPGKTLVYRPMARGPPSYHVAMQPNGHWQHIIKRGACV